MIDPSLARRLLAELIGTAGKGIDAVCPILDDIDARVRGLLAGLGVAATAATAEGTAR